MFENTTIIITITIVLLFTIIIITLGDYYFPLNIYIHKLVQYMYLRQE